jgi:hypothetical protein
VPDNVHWDPAYTAAEVAAVMQFVAPQDVPHPGDAVAMDDHGTSGHFA